MAMTPEQSRAARGLLNWSQEQLADAASVGLSTVRSFESGKRSPIANNLSAIRAAFENAGIQFLQPKHTAEGVGVALIGKVAE